MTEQAEVNQLILVSGFSGTGKSASLMNIRDQKDWLYLNTESGKRLPFANKFDSHTITDPYQVHDAFEFGIGEPEVKGIVIDSLTFLMDMFNTIYIYNAADGRAAWADYAQFFRKMLMELVPTFNRPVIFTAHVRNDVDENTGKDVTSVPIQGQLKGVSVESFFSTIVSTKALPCKALAGYENKMLNITAEEKELDMKHVFQTRLTKHTTGERIRSPIGFFGVNETFIDNDCQVLLDHLDKMYRG